MYTDVYADVLFLINFSMDAIALYVSARLCAARIYAGRIAVGAIVGGIYSVISIFLGLGFWIELFVFLVVCLLMCAIALAPDSFLEAFRYSAVMFISSSLIGGIMSASYSTFNTVFSELVNKSEKIVISPLVFSLLACFSMVAALFLCRLHGSGSLPDKAEVSVTLLGKSINVEGILDSGNMLKDPLSGKLVIVVSSQLLSHVLSKKFIQAADKADISAVYSISDEERKKFRLVPSSSLGGGSYLFGVLPDDLKITYTKKGKKRSVKRDAVIALAPRQSLRGDIRCVIPQSII